MINKDFNAKVGDKRVEDVVGPSGIGTVNERGSRLFKWCQINDFTITNTWYKTTPGDSGLGRAPGIKVETKSDSETPSKHRNHCWEPTVIQIILQ
ncbi:craniofacial development protein 2-like [Plakobranchus ocellatus]|uniref:Craniofacial development protein 2-like n=1 Tax=Plakobranchus ocellatus TaxID=259542 RepID=A0AAV4AE52_9GAST|nr:craniofacial development protein 2-like [Plakobranchus ocellatus]